MKLERVSTSPTERRALPAQAPTNPYSSEAQLLLESLRPPLGSRRFNSAPRPRIPERNRHKLVIPPVPINLKGRLLTTWQIEHGTEPSKHHLYYPKPIFNATSALAKTFRENKFNLVTLPNFQHRRIHARQDPFILRYPTYLIPDRGVMLTFMDEAETLESLDVCVRAIDMIENSLYDIPRSEEAKIMDDRDEKLEELRIACQRAKQTEIIFPALVSTALANAARFVDGNRFVGSAD